MQRQRRAGLGAVDEREALLGFERERREAEPREGVGRWHTRAVGVETFTLAHEREREVRKRRKISAGAHTALRWNAGHEPRVVGRHQTFDDHGTHAAVPTRQTGHLEREHESHHGRRHGRTHSHTVTANEIALQGGQIIGGNARGGELAEARIDAIHRRLTGSGLLHHGSAGGNGRVRRGVDDDAHVTLMQCLQVVEREGAGNYPQGGTCRRVSHG